MVLLMMDEPDRFLSLIQIGITLVGIISGAYGGIVIADDISKLFAMVGIQKRIADDISLVMVVGFITYLSIVFGEIVPKTIALKNPEKIILAVMPIVNIFSIEAHPHGAKDRLRSPPVSRRRREDGLATKLQFDMPPLENLTPGRLISYIDKAWDRKPEILKRIEGLLPDLQKRARQNNTLPMEPMRIIYARRGKRPDLLSKARH
jgi:hypothetical protein